MGKQFVTRTRAEWEMLAAQEVPDIRGPRPRATVWLKDMLQRFNQAGPASPMTLAVPERFLETLGVSPMTSASPDKPRD